MLEVSGQPTAAAHSANGLDRWFEYGGHVIRSGTVLVLLAAVTVFAFSTWRWPLFWDAQVFRYVNFLVAHGWHPYRDIVDMNLPGSYLADYLVLHTLGASDLAWRLYDFILLALLTASAIVITRPYEWIGGLFAGVQFTLFHALDGPYDAGQRDELLTVLLCCALAFLFLSLRHRKHWLAAGFGVCLSSAVSIKPTAAPVGLAVLLLLLWKERADRPAAKAHLGWILLGAAGPALVVIGYLEYHHAFRALVDISRRITPLYTALLQTPLPVLLRNALPFTMWPMLVLWAALLLSNLYAGREQSEFRFERSCILVNFAFGVLSYYVQHKGYAYHRYPLLAFLLLALALELGRLRRRPGKAVTAAAMLATIVVLLTPLTARHVKRNGPRTENEFPRALQADLRSLGEDQLQHRVQCLDLVTGCLSALYREKLLPSTGTIGDLVLFATTPSPVVNDYRDQFLGQLQTNPPNAIIVSDEWYGQESSFDKLNTWPAFAAYLRDHYHVLVTRHFKQDQSSAYRLYVRNGFTPSTRDSPAAPRPGDTRSPL